MADTQPERRIVIAHPNGETYAVTETTLHEVYAPRGFVGVTWQDTGAAYQTTAPQPDEPVFDSAGKGEA
jgi:hypothetical protein